LRPCATVSGVGLTSFNTHASGVGSWWEVLAEARLKASERPNADAAAPVANKTATASAFPLLSGFEGVRIAR